MHTNCSIYSDLVSIEVIQTTPPCCLPTSFPFFLPPVFTTHSSSSSIYTIYESSDPKGEMVHSVDYFHLVFPHERHSWTRLLFSFISFFFSIFSSSHLSTSIKGQPWSLWCLWALRAPVARGSLHIWCVHCHICRGHNNSRSFLHTECCSENTLTFWSSSALRLWKEQHEWWHDIYHSITHIDHPSVRPRIRWTSESPHSPTHPKDVIL